MSKTTLPEVQRIVRPGVITTSAKEESINGNTWSGDTIRRIQN